MPELTKAQFEQQDAIDNAIFEFLVKQTGHMIPWNIEEIGAVRDAVLPIIARHTGRSEYELYPWVTEDGEATAC